MATSGESPEAEEADWEIATADSLRERGEYATAADWYRRATQHLIEAGQDDRALDVAKKAAETAALANKPAPAAKPDAVAEAKSKDTTATGQYSSGKRRNTKPPIQPAPAKTAALIPGSKPGPAGKSVAPPTPATKSVAPPPPPAAAHKPGTSIAPPPPGKPGASVASAQKPAPAVAPASRPEASKPVAPAPSAKAEPAKAEPAKPAPARAEAPRSVAPPAPRPSAFPPPPPTPSLSSPSSSARGSMVPPMPGASAAPGPSMVPPAPRLPSMTPPPPVPAGGAPRVPMPTLTPPSPAQPARVEARKPEAPAKAEPKAEPKPEAAKLASPKAEAPAAKPARSNTGRIEPAPAAEARKPEAPARPDPMRTEAPSRKSAYPPTAAAPVRRRFAYAPARGSEVDQILARLPLLELFAEVPAGRLVEIARQMAFARFRNGETIIEAGGNEACMHLLLEGGATVRIPGESEPLGSVRAGELLGELGAYFGGPRTASAVAQGDVNALAFPAPLVHALGREFDALRNRLIAVAKPRAMGNLLRTSPVLQRFEPAARSALLSEFSEVFADLGDLLMVHGEAPDGMYLVAAGEVEAYGGEAGLLSPLLARAGEAFGVAATITREPCGVTARARRPALLVHLPRTRFPDVARQYPALQDLLADVGEPGRGVVC